MKYYYNGQLVRTSDNDYDYALLSIRKDGTYKTFACSKNYESLLKKYRYMTKAERLANENGITIEEAYNKFRLFTSQCYKSAPLAVVKLEKGGK